jgi:hypothetical protein
VAQNAGGLSPTANPKREPYCTCPFMSSLHCGQLAASPDSQASGILASRLLLWTSRYQLLIDGLVEPYSRQNHGCNAPPRQLRTGGAKRVADLEFQVASDKGSGEHVDGTRRLTCSAGGWKRGPHVSSIPSAYDGLLQTCNDVGDFDVSPSCFLHQAFRRRTSQRISRPTLS